MRTQTTTDTIRQDITNRKQRRENGLLSAVRLLDEDFVYQFPFHGENVWKTRYILNTYDFWLKRIADGDETLLSMFSRDRRQFRQFINNPANVRQNSTGALSRECSVWRYECNLMLLEEIEELLEYIKEAADGTHNN
jgi:hypothetical protein